MFDIPQLHLENFCYNYEAKILFDIIITKFKYIKFIKNSLLVRTPGFLTAEKKYNT